MKNLSLITMLVISLFLIGCGGTDKPAPNAAQNAQNTQNTKPEGEKKDEAKSEGEKKDEAKSDTEKADSAGVTGVAACDEYLAKMEKYLENPNVPQAARDAQKKAFEQSRDAWKQAASTPQGKAGLESSCKAALDAAKSMFEQAKIN